MPKKKAAPLPPAQNLWRAGRKLGRTLYRGEELVGMMDDAGDAALVVRAVNELLARGLEQGPREVSLGSAPSKRRALPPPLRQTGQRK